MRSLPLLFLFAAATLPSVFAADGKLTLNAGLDYSSGKYGDTSSTDIWALPISLKYKTDAFSLRVSSSWLRVTGPGTVTPDGEPVGAGGARTTESGPGDITATLTLPLIDDSAHPIGLDVAGKIKFGTADAAKFLGTGKNDYALQASFFKTLAAFTPYLDVGYKWKGDPAGIDYRNVGFGSLGADYRFSKRYSAGAGYDWRQKLTASGSAVSEAMLYFNTRLDDANKLNLYAVSGFSDASPDWGLGFTLSHGF